MRQVLITLLIASLTACGGNDATVYAGSAMNVTMPDSAISIRLTLWDRTDTSAAGFLRSDAKGVPAFENAIL